MDKDYFSLTGPAFRLRPDPTVFFGSRSHNKAMSYLHYGLKQREGFVVLTGAPGLGKTLTAAVFAGQARDAGVTAAAAPAQSGEGGEAEGVPDRLLDPVVAAFGLDVGSDGDAGRALRRFLFEEMSRGRRVLLILDEAQRLSVAALDMFRVLSETHYHGTPLLQVFLVGEVALEETLQAPALTALRQHTLASCRLEPLSREETREYILYRLSMAGWREDPAFADEAMARIYEATGGAPIRINRVCARIIEDCVAARRHDVSAAEVDAAVGALRHENAYEQGADKERAKKEGAGDDGSEDAAPPAGAFAGSEFDRLIAMRRAGEESHVRQEATLSDVASAIAAAANGSAPPGAAGAGEDPDAAIPSADDPARLSALRRELNEAEEMIAALRRKARSRRLASDDRDAAFAAGLARAGALIEQLRRLAP